MNFDIISYASLISCTGIRDAIVFSLIVDNNFLLNNSLMEEEEDWISDDDSMDSDNDKDDNAGIIVDDMIDVIYS